MAEMLKKMSPKTVLGRDPKALIPEEENGVGYLFTIFGTARDVRSGESTYGPWSSLIGQFEAIVPATEDAPEKVYQSAQCFLPEPMHSMLVSKLRSADAEAIDFAVKVLIKNRPDTAKNYEYLGEMIQDANAADPLQLLRDKARAALSALEAPKEEKPKATGKK